RPALSCNASFFGHALEILMGFPSCRGLTDCDNIGGMNRTAVLYALLSAALFGVSTPAAKGLVGTVDPVVLAGLLYCGAGIGVAMLRRLARAILAPAALWPGVRGPDNP